MKKIFLKTNLENQDNQINRLSVDLNKGQQIKLSAIMKKYNYNSKKKLIVDLIEKQYDVEFPNLN